MECREKKLRGRSWCVIAFQFLSSNRKLLNTMFFFWYGNRFSFMKCMHNTSRLIAPAWESRGTPDDYRRPSGARVVTGRRWERRSSMRSVALNGRGRRPVLAELTVIPRGCRAELSTTGRTSFKETDKSESPSHRCELRLVPTSLGRV